MANLITRDQLTAKLDAGEPLILVEALPAQYYDAQHLPGALNLPHDRIDELAPALLPDQTAEIVVYCASHTCPNSRIAADRLVELGYTRVWDYDGGKKDWIEAGLPTEALEVATQSG